MPRGGALVQPLGVNTSVPVAREDVLQRWALALRLL